jgi:hypothetical protein
MHVKPTFGALGRSLTGPKTVVKRHFFSALASLYLGLTCMLSPPGQRETSGRRSFEPKPPGETLFLNTGAFHQAWA